MSSLPSLPVFSSSTSASSEVLLGRTAMSLSKRTMISSGVRPLQQRLSAAEGWREEQGGAHLVSGNQSRTMTKRTIWTPM